MLQHRVVMLVLFLMQSAPAFCETQTNSCGRYSVWTPDNWKVTIDGERLIAESRDNEINLVVSPLKDKSADLLDEDITDFISEEIDETKFASDRREKVGEFEARVLEGTGFDEGDIVFKAVAIDPGGNAGVIELVLYAAPKEINRQSNKETVDRILRSFKPN